MLKTEWKILENQQIPQWFIEAVKDYTPASEGIYAAQLLWQRGIQNLEMLAGFLNPNNYKPTSPFAFGQEMKWAVKRLQKAQEIGEKVAIWGDFDADGVTATSVLWEGLGQFFTQEQNLSYYIPNRLIESHGLNCSGIDKLAEWGAKLIVTCDTGSTNLSEIEYAKKLGIDIIITDHHTLLDERPDVVAILNPRYLAETHPLFHFSGVAVAYKLIEAVDESWGNVNKKPVEDLLDLVAIGLIADLVELKGDCRYLAQKGIEKLQKTTRPGVKILLELCQKKGDRPTDISFGIGPRINAVSRIYGDASFCVELLTSKDVKRCKKLAENTELANTRRKSLQQDVFKEVKQKIAQLDLSTTSVIVLESPQWEVGVLGLVAGQIAQEYGRPTILLSTGEIFALTSKENNLEPPKHPPQPPLDKGGSQTMLRNFFEREKLEEGEITSNLARGSARSVNNIDLYNLVKNQAHLLHRFGGHPYAAGLSIPIENISLFRDAINQQLRQMIEINLNQQIITADLMVTVSELGQSLFRELKLIEPCGMGNPAPKLLIKNCTFEKTWHKNEADFKGRKVQYIKTTFKLCDESCNVGFPGVWWGHYQNELQENKQYDVIVELDFNSYKKDYEVRLIDLKLSQENQEISKFKLKESWLIDWRGSKITEDDLDCLMLKKCPSEWEEIQKIYRKAMPAAGYAYAFEKKLALAYSSPEEISARDIWEKLIGIVKYLSRTGKIVTWEQIKSKLGISDRSLNLGTIALAKLGVKWENNNGEVKVSWSKKLDLEEEESIINFIEAVGEEQFLHEYFYKVPVTTIQSVLEIYS